MTTADGYGGSGPAPRSNGVEGILNQRDHAALVGCPPACMPCGSATGTMAGASHSP